MVVTLAVYLAQLLNSCDALRAIDPPPAPPAIEQSLDDWLSDQHLPEGQLRDIRQHAQKFAATTAARGWTDKQLSDAKHRLICSVLEATIPSCLSAKLFDNSGLTESEKLAARMALVRYGRALATGKLAVEQMMMLEAMVCQPERHQLRTDVSDAELSAFVEALGTLADQADIPKIVPAADASDLFAAEVDRLLNGDTK
jgi:hypothetical protein